MDDDELQYVITNKFKNVDDDTIQRAITILKEGN